MQKSFTESSGWDWLGYAPGESPIRKYGVGSTSPKKKTMNWRNSGDSTDGLKPLPKLDSSKDVPTVIKVESIKHESDSDVVEVETEDGGTDESGSEAQSTAELLESESSSSDSDLDVIPPPIEIPDALKVKTNRDQHLAPPKRIVSDESSDSDSSESEGGSYDKEEPQPKKFLGMAPPMGSMRPQITRGASFSDEDPREVSHGRRAGRKPTKESDEDEFSDDEDSDSDNEDEDSDKEVTKTVKKFQGMAPPMGPLRPQLTRGESFEDETKELGQREKRAGRRPHRKDDSESDEEDDIVNGDLHAKAATPDSLRPQTLRGRSFDDESTENTAFKPRGGKKKPSSLRPATLRGRSIMDASTSANADFKKKMQRTGSATPRDRFDESDDSDDSSEESDSRQVRRGGTDVKQQDHGKISNNSPTSQTQNQSSRNVVQHKGTGEIHKVNESSDTAYTESPKSPRQSSSTRSPRSQPKSPVALSPSQEPARIVPKPLPPSARDEEDDRQITWEKPEWAKKKPLKSSAMSPPVEGAKKEIAWQKPDWAVNVNLRGTKKGAKLKSGENLSRPIGGIKPLEGNPE